MSSSLLLMFSFSALCDDRSTPDSGQIVNSSITASTVVSNVVFSFGTTADASNVPGGGGGGGGFSVVPEPGSALLLGSGMLGMLVFLRKFAKSA